MRDARLNPDDRLEGIEFDPVALGQRRHGLNRVGIAAIVLAIGLAAAVVKPWAGSSAASVAGASTPPGASIAPAAASTPSPDAASPRPSSPPSPSQMAAAVEPHDAWGVRAVVRRPAGLGDPDGPEYSERWAPAVERDDGSRLSLLSTGDRAVVAIGVTTPAGETPLDFRIWRPTADGDWESLDVRQVVAYGQGGVLLLAPPTTNGLAGEIWPAGSYRIELRIGKAVGIIDVGLPGRFERIQPMPSFRLPPDSFRMPSS